MNRENYKKHGFKKGNDNSYTVPNTAKQAQSKVLKNESIEEGEIVSQ